VRELADDATELAAATNGALADHLAVVPTARYAKLVSGWDGEMDDAFRRQVFALIDIAFAQRRKTLRNAFADWAGSGARSAELLAAAGIDPTRRGETLSIADFVRLLQVSGDSASTRDSCPTNSVQDP